MDFFATVTVSTLQLLLQFMSGRMRFFTSLTDRAMGSEVVPASQVTVPRATL